MTRKNFITVLVAAVLLLMTFGCGSIPFLNTDEGPELDDGYKLITLCGGNATNVNVVYEGQGAIFRTTFTTGNVNQDFDVNFILDSSVVAAGSQVYADPVFTITELTPLGIPGTAKGVMQIDISLNVPCSSSGPYRLTIAVEDSNDESDVMNYEFMSTESLETDSGNGCNCITQCNDCGNPFSRYWCSCMRGNDQDVIDKFMEDNPDAPIPHF